MNYETGVVSETPTSLEGDYGIAAEDKPFYRNWKRKRAAAEAAGEHAQ